MNPVSKKKKSCFDVQVYGGMRGINVATGCSFVVHYAFSVTRRGISGPTDFGSSFTFAFFAFIMLTFPFFELWKKKLHIWL